MNKLPSNLLAIAFALLLSSRLPAQSYLYALNGEGQVVLNDAKLYGLPGDFDPDEPDEETEEEWIDQALQGGDHFALRRDGKVFKNGVLEFDLAFGGEDWVRIDVTAGGEIFCLSSNGKMSRGAIELHDLPAITGERSFRDFFLDQGQPVSLRKDGVIFRSDTQVFDLPGDGSSGQQYMDFTRDSATGDIYAIRRRGELFRAESGGSASGVQVAFLASAGEDEDYVDLVLDGAGSIRALREDGAIYDVDTSTGMATLFVDLPDGQGKNVYVSLILARGRLLTLRWNGEVYFEDILTEVCQFKGEGYQNFLLTDQSPNISNAKDSKPVVSVYTTTCHPGNNISFPILATDVNDGLISYNAVELPAGATFDSGTNPPTFSWTPAAVGKFTFAVEITSGASVKTYKYKITVKASDVDPAKNKKPKFQALKKVQLFVGVEIDLPLVAYDPDGDPLTYSIDILPPGATFDPATGTLTWTPPICTGKLKITWMADDGGGKIVKKKVKIDVKTALHN